MIQQELKTIIFLGRKEWISTYNICCYLLSSNSLIVSYPKVLYLNVIRCLLTLAVLALVATQAFLCCSNGGYSLVAVHGISLGAVLLSLRSTAQVPGAAVVMVPGMPEYRPEAVVHGLSCSTG